MTRRRIYITLATAAATAAFLMPAVGAAATGTSAAATAPPQIRVNQVGFVPGAPKVAELMLAGSGEPLGFTLIDSHGHTVYRGMVGRYLGSWNATYHTVLALDFSRFTRTGTYRVSSGGVTSPPFRIADGAALYSGLLANAVRYFTSERDGADVVHSVLDREPANLTDERAAVYGAPTYVNDNLIGTLHKIGGPVNVSGGWFDAGGGYEKFGYTGSYADALLLLAARTRPGDATLGSEARFGLDWIAKLYNPKQRVLYMQVGIGNGNASGTIQGDYDYWFLPQREDHLGARPGSPPYFVEYRPVFEAAAPGHLVSPDLAGRYAADYALGAQVERDTGLLSMARSVFADAQTSHVSNILTTYPHDYYPGTQWRADMFWGATEIALADEALHLPNLRADLATAQRWARAYLAEPRTDTLNLYDTGALAEAELLRALSGQPARPEYGSLRGALLGDMVKQLKLGESLSRGDPFGLGTTIGRSDASPHAFGLWVTDTLYRAYGGSGQFNSFAQQQLNFALGANPWGSSFVVGAGTVYPHCLQSEIANLAGSLTGHGDIQVGAVGDGPSSPSNFVGLGTVPGMRACSAGKYGPFNSTAAAYEDNVVSWPSVEPADDYTAVSLLAFALGAARG
jgi:endoglucanase